MITFPHGITDEEIETLTEQAQDDVEDTLHDLAVKRKKLVESGVPKLIIRTPVLPNFIGG